MKSLPNTFSDDGFVVRVVKRRGRVALLAKSNTRISDRYEVIIIQRRPEESIHGKDYPAREVMPRSEQWGECAWSPIDRQAAETKFEELTRKGGFSREGIA